MRSDNFFVGKSHEFCQTLPPHVKSPHFQDVGGGGFKHMWARMLWINKTELQSQSSKRVRFYTTQARRGEKIVPFGHSC